MQGMAAVIGVGLLLSEDRVKPVLKWIQLCGSGLL